MVVNNASVGTNGDVDAGFRKVFITCTADINESGCLSSSDSFRFPGNADRSAATSDFDTVSSAFGEKTESCCVDHVTGSDPDSLPVVLPDPVDCQLLPLGKSLG